jgi:parvulin-like peptidyl-prolyl isomerase
MLRPKYEEMISGMDPVDAEIQLRDWSRENVIERVLLRQEALKDPEPIAPERIAEGVQAIKSQSTGRPGCEVPVDEEELRRQVEISLRVERFLQKITSQVPPPKPKEVSEHYRKHRDQFYHPELVRASHVVKNVDEKTDEATALEGIRTVQQELGNGGEFVELADRYSDCPGNGGDLGYFPRGEMVEEFDRVVFSLRVNETSDIFRTPFGFHIARVYDRKPEGIPSLEEAREEIAALLHREKQERFLEDYVDRLKAKAVIQNVKDRHG